MGGYICNGESHIKLLVDEYREVQQEKRLYIQMSFAVLTAIPIVSVALLSVMPNMRTDASRLGVALAFQLAQLALLLVFQILSAFSLRHAMYASTIEERVSEITDERVLLWERVSAGDYPGRLVWVNRRSTAGERSPGSKPGASSHSSFIDRYLVLLGAILVALLSIEVAATAALITRILESTPGKIFAVTAYVAFLASVLAPLGFFLKNQGARASELRQNYRTLRALGTEPRP